LTPRNVQNRSWDVKPIRADATQEFQLVDVDALAHEAGVRPDLVKRFMRLGLLEPAEGTFDTPRFPRHHAAKIARATRLRRDLELNYAGAVLACELLDRIDSLEVRLSRYETITKHG
jgi:MerR HTH family regulatory protein